MSDTEDEMKVLELLTVLPLSPSSSPSSPRPSSSSRPSQPPLPSPPRPLNPQLTKKAFIDHPGIFNDGEVDLLLNKFNDIPDKPVGSLSGKDVTAISILQNSIVGTIANELTRMNDTRINNILTLATGDFANAIIRVNKLFHVIASEPSRISHTLAYIRLGSYRYAPPEVRIVLKWQERGWFTEFPFRLPPDTFRLGRFDGRTLLAVLSTEDWDLSRYTKFDRQALLRLAKSPGLREEEVINHPDMEKISPALKSDIQFYTEIYSKRRLYESWFEFTNFIIANIHDDDTATVVSGGSGGTDTTKITFTTLNRFVDRMAHFILNDFIGNKPDSKALLFDSKLYRDLISIIQPLTPGGKTDMRMRISRDVESALEKTRSTWEFSGTQRRHYLYRDIEIFKSDERKAALLNRIESRINVTNLATTHGPGAFWLSLVYHCFAMDMLGDIPETIDIFQPSFLESFIERMDFLTMSEDTLWNLDAIMNVIAEEPYEDSQSVDISESTRSEDVALVTRTNKALRIMFRAFSAYSLENMDKIKSGVVKTTAIRAKIEAIFNIEKRANKNLSLLKVRAFPMEYLKNSNWFTTDGKYLTKGGPTEYVAGVAGPTEYCKWTGNSSLGDATEYADRTPWLDTERSVITRTLQFQKEWKRIKELANMYETPWLLLDIVSGFMTDPISGNTYGRPGSDEFQSEIQRRQAGIPSIYWYGKGADKIRSMPRMDRRRLHGGDGFLFAPSPFPPTTGDEDWLAWREEVAEFQTLAAGLTSAQIAKMYTYSAPPTHGCTSTLPTLAIDPMAPTRGTGKHVISRFNDSMTLAEMKMFITRWWDWTNVQPDVAKTNNVSLKKPLLAPVALAQKFQVTAMQLDMYRTGNKLCQSDLEMDQEYQTRKSRFDEFNAAQGQLADQMDVEELSPEQKKFREESYKAWNELIPGSGFFPALHVGRVEDDVDYKLPQNVLYDDPYLTARQIQAQLMKDALEIDFEKEGGLYAAQFEGGLTWEQYRSKRRTLVDMFDDPSTDKLKRQRGQEGTQDDNDDLRAYSSVDSLCGRMAGVEIKI